MGEFVSRQVRRAQERLEAKDDRAQLTHFKPHMIPCRPKHSLSKYMPHIGKKQIAKGLRRLVTEYRSSIGNIHRHVIIKC